MSAAEALNDGILNVIPAPEIGAAANDADAAIATRVAVILLNDFFVFFILKILHIIFGGLKTTCVYYITYFGNMWHILNPIMPFQMTYRFIVKSYYNNTLL